MRRVGLLTSDDATNLLQFLDQMHFGMQAAGGVDQQYVNATALGCLDAVKDHGGRIGAGAVLDHFDTDSLTPDIELFDRSGTKSVAGDEQRLFPGAVKLRGEFADGGGFADAIDAEK